MKILQLTPEFPPVQGYGVSRYVTELSTSLVKLGHDVHVFATRGERPPADHPIGELHVHGSDRGYPFFAYAASLQAVLETLPACESLVKLWDDRGPFDAAVSHDWSSFLAASVLQRVRRAKTVAVVHDLHAPEGRAENPEEAYEAEMERWMLRQADGVVATSPFLGELLASRFEVDRSRICVAEPSVRTEIFHAEIDRAEFRALFASAEQALVLFVGRLAPAKGPDVFLDLAARLLTAKKSIRFAMVGDGPMRPWIEEQVSKRGFSSSVRLTGHLGPAVLGSLYRVADALVIPSRFEASSLCAREAVSLGLPVIGLPVGDLVELAQVHESIRLVPGPERLEEALFPLPKPRTPGDFRSWEETARAVAGALESVRRRT